MIENARKSFAEAEAAVLATISTNHEKEYIRYHRPRLEILYNLVAQFTKPGQPILDIGPGPQTLLFLAGFPDNPIDTLGFQSFNSGFDSCRKHYNFDLNDLEQGLSPATTENYALIVFGEILEHLYFAPHHLMRMFKALQSKAGGGGDT